MIARTVNGKASKFIPMMTTAQVTYEDRHKRNDLLGDAGDAAYSTTDDRSHDTCNQKAEQPALVAPPARVNPTGYVDELHVGLVRLEHVAYPHAANDDADGIKSGHEFSKARDASFSQSLFQVVHGPAGYAPIWILAAILGAKRTFDKLGGHP